MGYRELFTSPPLFFGGIQTDYDKADYVVLGVPLDATGTYRRGARFAPLAIREASLNIETYSFRSGIDLEELRLQDLGDLHVTGDVEETLRRVDLVTREIYNDGKFPILIGGEHTITLGAMRAFDKNTTVLSFDAHLDLRNEFMGQTICHATLMRRIADTVKPKGIIEVGTRAVCREEVDYAENSNILFFTSQYIMEHRVEDTAQEILKLLGGYDRLYLTIDMDILDPAFAPAVQNPEPDGLSTHLLLNLLCEICSRRIDAFDIVEVTPHYDSGVTALQAARIINELLCLIERERRKL